MYLDDSIDSNDSLQSNNNLKSNPSSIREPIQESKTDLHQKSTTNSPDLRAPLNDDDFVDNNDSLKHNSWNEKFQRMLDESRNNREDLNGAFRNAEQMATLYDQFAAASTEIGLQIINHELSVPNVTQKVGGLMGGEKFIRDGIFFKLASDDNSIFGGHNHLAASKSAKHELKNLMHLIDCRVEGLHFPLCAVISFRGRTLIALSQLPIDKTTLKCGSQDGGLTLKSADLVLNAKLAKIAQLLNLKGHFVESKDHSQTVFFFGPADLEIHQGFDGRLYVIDCARLLPPSFSAPPHHLFEMFRIEFLRTYEKPLCSDAMSKFVRKSDFDEHKQEILDATIVLEERIIPEFAKLLLKSNKKQTPPKNDESNEKEHEQQQQIFTLTEDDKETHAHEKRERKQQQLIADLHSRGINVRYLGLLFNLLKKEAENEELEILDTISIEMIARATKDELQVRWREIFCTSDADFVEVSVELIKKFENLNDSFWNETILEKIASKFQLSHVKQFEVSEQNSMATNVLKSMKNLSERILKRVCCLSGISFIGEEKERDKIQLKPVVKYLNRISFEEGLAIARLAMETMKTNIEKSEQLFEQSSLKFRECLRNKPNDMRALSNLALILTVRARLQTTKQQQQQQTNKNDKSNKFSSLELLKHASGLYERLIHGNSNHKNNHNNNNNKNNTKFNMTGDNRVLLQYGHNLLEQYKLLKETKECENVLQSACECFERAISMGKGNLNADVYYDCGTAYLMYAKLQSDQNRKPDDIHSMLDKSLFFLKQTLQHEDEKQTNTIANKNEPNSTTTKKCAELDPSKKSNYLRNIGICLERKAMLLSPLQNDEETIKLEIEIFENSFSHFEFALKQQPENPETLFDYANARHKFATKLESRITAMLEKKLTKELIDMFLNDISLCWNLYKHAAATATITSMKDGSFSTLVEQIQGNWKLFNSFLKRIAHSTLPQFSNQINEIHSFSTQSLKEFSNEIRKNHSVTSNHQNNSTNNNHDSIRNEPETKMFRYSDTLVSPIRTDFSNEQLFGMTIERDKTINNNNY